MDAVGLEHCIVFGKAFEQKRHQRRLALAGNVGIRRLEASYVSQPVVRRKAQAHDQHPRAALLRGGDHGVEVRPHCVQAATAQAVVAA